jgi:transposase
MLTAPKPAKLIAKGLFAVDFWVRVLLKKFEFAQPIQRTIRELRTHGLHVSPGTLSGGLEKIGAMVQPLAGQFVLHSREGAHWHMDETRWPMFCLTEAKGRSTWWFWVVVSQDVTAFLLEPSRAGKVPRDFFPKGTAGIVSVDRYAGYCGLLGSDWSLQLAYCWSHQRRDFIQVAESSKGTPAGVRAQERSGELACACFTLLATLRQHGLCPRRYFQAYWEACASHGGRAPENLEEFLPWKWSAEKRAAWQTQGRPP